jgi:hypothetical protein
MAMTIHKNFFSDRNEALDDIKKSGFWPSTLVAGPSTGLEVHWHTEDVHAYIVEGDTWFLDGETGVRHTVATGDKIVIPTGTLHAEGEILDQVIYYIGLSKAVDSEEFLKLRPPEDRAG